MTTADVARGLGGHWDVRASISRPIASCIDAQHALRPAPGFRVLALDEPETLQGGCEAQTTLDAFIGMVGQHPGERRAEIVLIGSPTIGLGASLEPEPVA